MRIAQYRTPDAIAEDSVCLFISIPDNPEFRAALVDVIAYLARQEAWVDGGVAPFDAGAVFSGALYTRDVNCG